MNETKRKIRDALNKLSLKLIPVLLRYDFFRQYLRFTRGNSEEHLYKEAFLSHVTKTLQFLIIASIASLSLILLEGVNKSTLFLSGILLPCMGILPFNKVKREYRKNESELHLGLENLVNELAILVSSGMSLDASIRLARSERETYEVMKKLYKHLEDATKKGWSINHALLVFGKIYRNRYLNKLNVLISQANKKGPSKQAESLMFLATEMMNERRNQVRKKAETISTKMLMPLMISMVGIIVMIMVPIFLQF